jgi:hypothetical protein
MRNRTSALVALSFLALAGCAARGRVASPVPANPLGDRPLYVLLSRIPLEGAARDSLDAYERSYRNSFLERVATVASDSAASTPVRHNAITLLGERGAVGWLPALRGAQRSPDLRVRGAVLVAAQKMIDGGHAEARALIVAGLDDPAPEIQAKALELLGANDLQLLRDFVRRHPEGAPSDIARGLLLAAEDRGYALAPDSAGVIRRTTGVGHVLEYVPVRRWEQWDAALGTVTIVPAGGAPLRLDSIEVVRGVVPVAFSPAGRYVAYERGRHIFMHDLQTGLVRDLGPGVAPRLRPLTDELLFLREVAGGRNQLAQRTRMSYEVLLTPFGAAASEPHRVGILGVFVQPDRHGGYSPVRWMHIAERHVKFYLEADGLESFALPDPLSGRES